MTDEQLLKNIMPDIEEYFILNNRPIVIEPGYEWFREVITLYAKQHNLLESAMLLLDNGMNEEALILARSAMNNYFLIGYLLNDNGDRLRLKEYSIQPLITQRYFLQNVKEMLKGSFGKRMKRENVKLSLDIKDVKNKIKESTGLIESEGFLSNIKPLSILKLAAKSGKQGFDFYTTYYGDASKFEHSDISSLDIYKKVIDEQTPIDRAFIMDLNRTDEKLKEKVITILTVSYLDSFLKILELISKKEKHLQSNYNVNKLSEIMLKVLAKFNK